MPDVTADRLPPFWTVTEFALTEILPPAPVLCVSVKMPLPVPSIRIDWVGLARPCTITSPAAPGPVDVAVMVPPEFRVTVSAFTKMAPPVAEGAVPEVAAESVPLFWTVREFVVMLILPPVPVPWVLVNIPLPVPSTRTD